MNILIIGATISTYRTIGFLLKNMPEFQVAGIVTLRDWMAEGKVRFQVLDGLARKHDLPLFKTSKISSEKAEHWVRDKAPDLIIEIGWSQIIPPAILEIPDKGCIGIHHSMLPKARGGASLNWSLILGETSWGVSLFQLNKQIDEGNIWAQREFLIEPRDDINTLWDKVDAISLDLLQMILPRLANGTAIPLEQDPSEGSYLKPRKPEDGRINWQQPCQDIYNAVRALYSPYPRPYFFYNDIQVYIGRASIPEKVRLLNGEPGQILAIEPGNGIVINTGYGSILIERLESEGMIETWADQWAQSQQISVGDYFT